MKKKSLTMGRRRGVSVSQDTLVETRPLIEGQLLPLLVASAIKGVDLLAWANQHRDQVLAWLHQHGAILFRGFQNDDGDGVALFRSFAERISPELLAYKERSSPRTLVSNNIYTSTEYPPEHGIFLHNENSYQKSWPQQLFFYCDIAAEQGGETPLGDCRRIYQAIEPAIIEKFKRLGVMYIRNFNNRFGLPWQEVFQTEDRAVVEAHCHKSGLQTEWHAGNTLRTRALRPLVDRHPVTGAAVWFNHAIFFNTATLEESMRISLESLFSPEEMPNHTYYGDGSPIEAEVIAQFKEVYQREEVVFPWQQGDILLVDNMLTAHGRRPFKGQRRILLAMA